MVGDNVVYESSFLSTREEKNDLKDLNADKSSVNLGSTLKKRAISSIKERLTFA